MKISSTAFAHEDMIPVRYTCDGHNVSPPLQWSKAPADTDSFALICDDPDALSGTWVHWVIFNIPPDVNGLPENMPQQKDVSGLGRNGKNDDGNFGYDGPAPPSGIHRYYFKLYALDAMLNLKPGITKEALLKAMKGHVLAEAQIMGKYGR